MRKPTKKVLSWQDFGLKENPFPGVDGPIKFGGLGCKDQMQFGYYNPKAKIRGKSIKEILPFAIALWHFKNPLADQFGSGTAVCPWDDGTETMENYERRLRVLYYFCYLLGVNYWCFHCLDLVPKGANLREFHRNLDAMLPVIKELTQLTGIKVGWTTQNLFSLPIYCEGAATSPELGVFAAAWAQTKKMLEVAKWLQDNDCGAKQHVFWGGREGYNQLLPTMLGAERKHLAAFLWMAVRYAKQIGLEIQFLIEPKWCEPSAHQYDASVAVVVSFLREFELLPYFKINIETNHAQLAGLPMDHECMLAANDGLIGGIDVNEGTYGNGWDTDRFLGDPLIAFGIMFAVFKQGGIGTGVFNFDAHRYRGAYSWKDLFYAHILGMDAIALGAAMADVAIENGDIDSYVAGRYASWQSETGQAVERSINEPGAVDFEAVAEQGYETPLALDPEKATHHEMLRSMVLRLLPAAFAKLAA